MPATLFPRRVFWLDQARQACDRMPPVWPLQSVHDGERLVHEPLRLSVLVEAERSAIDGILSRHPGVSQLFENGWLHLVALEDDAQTTWLRQPSSRWRRL